MAALDDIGELALPRLAAEVMGRPSSPRATRPSRSGSATGLPNGSSARRWA